MISCAYVCYHCYVMSFRDAVFGLSRKDSGLKKQELRSRALSVCGAHRSSKAETAETHCIGAVQGWFAKHSGAIVQEGGQPIDHRRVDGTKAKYAVRQHSATAWVTTSGRFFWTDWLHCRGGWSSVLWFRFGSLWVRPRAAAAARVPCEVFRWWVLPGCGDLWWLDW